MLQVLSPAPDFALLSSRKRTVALSQLKGRWVVLLFYSGDFTSVCGSEIPAFSSRLQEFRKMGAEVFGISADSVYTHMAWLKELRGEVELLSDFTKEVCRLYGVLLENVGEPLRATFIIDPNGVLRYSLVCDPGIGRNVDETLRVLQALQTGKSCPVDWKPGDPTLPT